MRRRLLLLFCALILMIPMGAMAGMKKYPELPKAFFVELKEKKITQKNGSFISAFYPKTINSQVDQELAAIVDGYIEKIATTLPEGKKTAPQNSRLDIRCVYSPTGESWISFLFLARTVHHREQLSVELTSGTYDANTGVQVLLTDIFPSDSPAWQVVADAVRVQLSAYFPGEEADQQTLNELCSREALERAVYTLGAMKMELHYPASLLYKDHPTVMHVKVYYNDLAGMMTEEAARQTDNSRYPMVALTFDDGPRYTGTVDLLDTLQAYGAKATFFLIGDQMENNRDVVQREHDEGHTVASHTYNHYQPSNLTPQIAVEHKNIFDELLTDMIGLPAPYMRAPGGDYKFYVNNNIGLPLIQWSLISHDIEYKSASPFVRLVSGTASDGGIVLMHDSKTITVKGIKSVLIRLRQRGILCVTVEDLFVKNNRPLENNIVYQDAMGKTLK